MIHRLTRQQTVPASLKEVWEFFASPHNLNEITPLDMRFEIIHGDHEPMYQGQLIEYRVQFMPRIKTRWLTEIAHVDAKNYFVDEQRLGPYRFWYHEHLFQSVNRGTRIDDRVTYEIPFGLLGDALNTVWVKDRLNTIFDYRRDKVKEIFG